MSVFDQLARGGRVVIGDRMLRPVGGARRLGFRPSRSELQWDAPLATAMLIVDVTGAGDEIDLEELDEIVRVTRKVQAKGRRVSDEWIPVEAVDDGSRRDTVSYLFVHDPTTRREATFESFERHVKILAENVVDELELRAVVLLIESEHGRHAYAFGYAESADGAAG